MNKKTIKKKKQEESKNTKSKVMIFELAAANDEYKGWWTQTRKRNRLSRTLYTEHKHFGEDERVVRRIQTNSLRKISRSMKHFLAAK